MKRWIILATLLAASLFVQTGCGPGVAYTERERQHRYARIIENDCRQFNDDWDYLWLMEDKSHLSMWQVDE